MGNDSFEAGVFTLLAVLLVGIVVMPFIGVYLLVDGGDSSAQLTGIILLVVGISLWCVLYCVNTRQRVDSLLLITVQDGWSCNIMKWVFFTFVLPGGIHKCFLNFSCIWQLILYPILNLQICRGF